MQAKHFWETSLQRAKRQFSSPALLQGCLLAMLCAICAAVPVPYAPVVLSLPMCMAVILHGTFPPLCLAFCLTARLCVGAAAGDPFLWCDGAAICLICFGAWGITCVEKLNHVWTMDLCIALCLLLSRAFMLRLLALDWIILFVQMLVSILLLPVFSTALDVLAAPVRRWILSQEETLALCATAACLLFGAVQFRIFTVSPAIVLCYFLILVLCHGTGVGLAAGSAAILGAAIAIGLSGQWLIVCNLTLCAVICAVFGRERKFLCALCFILTNAVLTLVINGSHEIILNLKESLPACLIFCAMPKRMLEGINTLLCQQAHQQGDHKLMLRRVSNAVHARLFGVSEVFSQMSQCFSSVAGAQEVSPQVHTQQMLQQIYSSVCAKCALANVCWKRAYDDTYCAMKSALENAREQGRFDARLLDRDFARRCMRSQQIIDTVNHMADLYISNRKWEQRVEESRLLVAQQLRGVSDIMHRMAEDMRLDICFDSRLEREIRVSLDRHNMPHDAEVTLWRSAGGYQVRLQCDRAADRIHCLRQGACAVGEALGCQMHMAGNLCDISGSGKCTCNYAQSVTYTLVTGTAGCAAYGQSVSGDSMAVVHVDAARMLVALSDGMGNGVRANQESSATVGLLSNFYKAGFTRDAALAAINRLLLLRSGEEMFSTVDMCVFDCSDGTCQVTKIAAAPGILYRNGKMQLLQSEALPMGVADTDIPPAQEYKLSHGEGILIFSDGVTDVFGDALLSICQSFWQDTDGQPQMFCDALIAAAIACSGDVARDDMSVVAAILMENT